jgi:hypothetical protein
MANNYLNFCIHMFIGGLCTVACVGRHSDSASGQVLVLIRKGWTLRGGMTRTAAAAWGLS